MLNKLHSILEHNFISLFLLFSINRILIYNYKNNYNNVADSNKKNNADSFF